MTAEEFTEQLRDAITIVLREKVAAGKIVIASNTGIDGLARELANNAAQAPWIDIEIEQEATEETLRNADTFRANALTEAKQIDAVLERHGIPLCIEGDPEPLTLALRVAMLGNKVLHLGTPAPAVARGPIALKRCVCSSPVFTCVTCNAVAPTAEIKAALIALVSATKELLAGGQVSWDAFNTKKAIDAAEDVLR